MTGLSATELQRHRGSAQQRTLFWRVCQVIIGGVFTVWMRYRTRGLEHVPREGGGLLLANHQSFLDPFLLGLPLSRPVSFIARDTLFRVPVVGYILRITHVIPINRQGGSSAVIRETLHRIGEGYLVGMFPEGTRSVDGQMGPLKPGFAALLRRADLPVVPVGIAGTGRALGRGSWFLKPRRIAVVYGEPLEAERIAELGERGREGELVEYVRSAIAFCQQQAEAELSGKSA